MRKEEEIRVIILAAGQGKRMRSEIPKVLHKLFEKEILSYVIESVIDVATKVYVIVGHKAELVKSFAEKNYPKVKCILQAPQLGTGDAVNKAYSELEDFKGDVLVLNGDIPLIERDTIEKFIEYHKKNKSDLTVLSTEFDDPTNYGRIVRENTGLLKEVVEEKDTDEIQKRIKEVNAGIYCFNWEKLKQALNSLTCNNAQKEYYLTDIIKYAVDKKLNVNAYKIEDNTQIFGINSKEQLMEANKILNERTIKRLLDKGVTIYDPKTTWISPDTEIEPDSIIYPSVYIEGKNYIGNKCKIGPFAHIRGNVVLGSNVKIGNFVELKNTQVGNNTKICHLSYIGDSQLGSEINIGAGTITANYNSISKEKNKTIVEDGVSVGANSVLIAPVKINDNAFIAAGSIVTQEIESNALAISRSQLVVIKDWVKKQLEKLVNKRVKINK